MKLIEGICGYYKQSNGGCTKNCDNPRRESPSLTKFPDGYKIVPGRSFNDRVYETRMPRCEARGIGGEITEDVAAEQSGCSGYKEGPPRRERIIFQQLPVRGK